MTKIGAARRILTAALSLGVLLLAGSAIAGGRVEWKTKSLKESDSHGWTIDVSIFLNRAPDEATLPMRFSFTPVVYYERALVDGKDGPQLRNVPLQNKQPLVESVDVGFLDPSNGQIQKRTRFSFKVTRKNGYEAGEYDVVVKDGRTDASLGGTTRVVFEGDNDVIDRRAVVFTGEKKKDKTDSDTKDQDQPPPKKELSTDDPAYWQGGPTDNEKKEEVQPKQGGCGCRIGANDAREGGLDAGLFALALGAQMVRRRRGARRG